MRYFYFILAHFNIILSNESAGVRKIRSAFQKDYSICNKQLCIFFSFYLIICA